MLRQNATRATHSLMIVSIASSEHPAARPIALIMQAVGDGRLANECDGWVTAAAHCIDIICIETCSKSSRGCMVIRIDSYESRGYVAN